MLEVINEMEADFGGYLTAKEIANRLNEAGYQTPRGCAWSHTQVLSMVYPFGQVRLASSKHVVNVPSPDFEQSIRYESDPANFVLVGVHPTSKITAHSTYTFNVVFIQHLTVWKCSLPLVLLLSVLPADRPRKPAA